MKPSCSSCMTTRGTPWSRCAGVVAARRTDAAMQQMQEQPAVEQVHWCAATRTKVERSRTRIYPISGRAEDCTVRRDRETAELSWDGAQGRP
eukprot:1148073-Pelagomonas_calceolata.AAC.18